MALHLIKLSVGPDSLADLVAYQTRRLEELARQKKVPELVHITRQTPKRAEELLQGGSIYWVIKGTICARQRLLELRPLLRDGVPHCGLVYDKEMVRVAPRPHRPFQGWRYFDSKNAPSDLAKDAAELPQEMLRELSVLGLL
jgi:hypothetical protein